MVSPCWAQSGVEEGRAWTGVRGRKPQESNAGSEEVHVAGEA